ncbi:hypothetical protein [Corynebacterium sp. UBA2622]|uniref:hypothetical protein n=1 Tax=Corynebacterium sp. UBA2622 TaxID=1946393 RepID=UPI0025C19908|nr:hypothetical protein [Corynebacterium sp. UBA2622]
MADAQEVDPPECAPLVPAAVSFISKVAANPDKLSVRELSSDASGGTVTAAVSSDPSLLDFPVDIGACAAVTKTMAGSDLRFSYAAVPVDLGVDGAGGSSAAAVTVKESSLEVAGPVGSTSRVAHVVMDGSAFTVYSSPEVPAEEFEHAVQAQAERIRQR